MQISIHLIWSRSNTFTDSSLQQQRPHLLGGPASCRRVFNSIPSGNSIHSELSVVLIYNQKERKPQSLTLICGFSFRNHTSVLQAGTTKMFQGTSVSTQRLMCSKRLKPSRSLWRVGEETPEREVTFPGCCSSLTSISSSDPHSESEPFLGLRLSWHASRHDDWAPHPPCHTYSTARRLRLCVCEAHFKKGDFAAFKLTAKVRSGIWLNINKKHTQAGLCLLQHLLRTHARVCACAIYWVCVLMFSERVLSDLSWHPHPCLCGETAWLLLGNRVRRRPRPSLPKRRRARIALPTHQGEGTLLCTCRENPRALLSPISRLCFPPSSLLTDTLRVCVMQTQAWQRPHATSVKESGRRSTEGRTASKRRRLSMLETNT